MKEAHSKISSIDTKLSCFLIMATSVCLGITSKAVVALIVVSAFVQIFPGKDWATFAIPSFAPIKYRFISVTTGQPLAVDEGGTIHINGDHRTGDNLCFFYHQVALGVVMLETTDGRGFVSIDGNGDAALSQGPFNDEDATSTTYRKFQPIYSSAPTSSHTQAQFEVADLPGCALAFDSEGVAANACDHAGMETETFTLLRCRKETFSR